MPHYLWHESHFRLRARRRHLLEVRRDTKKCKQVRRSMSTTLLLFLTFVSFSSLFVVAAPIQEEGLIGPVKEESELISAATTCQTAILRCCTPNTPTTDATWRCFEKNSCGGLFVVHTNDTETNITLGACAFLSKIKELVDEEDNNDSTVSVRNGERPDPEDDDLAKTDTGGSSQTHSLESIEESSKPDKIFRNPTMPQNPTNQKPFASNGCRGGTHERCIKDAEEGGCGALEQFGQEAYVKCVHHCVDHCKSPRDNLVESMLLQ